MKGRIWLALLAVYVFWGATYLAIRFAVESIPPFVMASTRFLTAGAVLYAWRRIAGDPRPTRVHWRSAAIVGLLMLLGGNGIVSWAEQYVASGIAALLVGTVPLWMVLMDALRRGGARPGWQSFAGVLLGFLGVAVLVGPSYLARGSLALNPLGVAGLLLAAFLWALGSLYSRRAQLPKSPLLGTAMEMLIGGLGLALFGAFTGDWSRVDLAAISFRSALGLLYLIVFGSLIAFVAYTWLLRVAPTALVATYAYVNPLVALFLGTLLAREPLDGRIFTSALIIIGAVVLINKARTPPRTQDMKVAFIGGER